MVKAKDLLAQTQDSDDSSRKYRSLEDIEEHLSKHNEEDVAENDETGSQPIDEEEDNQTITSTVNPNSSKDDQDDDPLDNEDEIGDEKEAKKDEDDDLDSEDDEVADEDDGKAVKALDNNPTEEVEDEDPAPKTTYSPEVTPSFKSENDEEEAEEVVEDLPPKRPASFETNLDDLATESKVQDDSVSNISGDFPARPAGGPIRHGSELDEEDSFESDIPRLGNNPPAGGRVPNGQEHQGQSNFSRQFGSYQLGERPQRGGNKWHVIILLLLGLAIIAGTIFFLKDQFMLGSAPTPSPSTANLIDVPAATPEPTPHALDRTKFKVRVLNGTQKGGLAASVSAKLKTLGYQSDRVGNAPKQDYEKTEIKVKQSNATLSGQLIKDLLPEFSASLIGELKDSDTADAEVILGTR